LSFAGRADPTLRPAGENDGEFLYRVYASTRVEELALLNWDDTSKEAFLRGQFAAQSAYYQKVFPEASYDVIFVDEMPVGRLYVERGPEAFLIIDIALLPEHRGKGIGTLLVESVLEEARSLGKPVRIHVERQNPARRLYERLGFRQIADQGIYLLLEFAP
jgi:GNAT superfamily N-acetyltransferase